MCRVPADRPVEAVFYLWDKEICNMIQIPATAVTGDFFAAVGLLKVQKLPENDMKVLWFQITKCGDPFVIEQETSLHVGCLFQFSPPYGVVTDGAIPLSFFNDYSIPHRGGFVKPTFEYFAGDHGSSAVHQRTERKPIV